MKMGRIATRVAFLAAIAMPSVSMAQDTTAATTTTTASGSSIPNLWGFLMPSQQQLMAVKAACAKCKEKICKCCVGQLLGSMTMPLSMMSGCIKPCCPPVSQEDLKAPADSAAGACARITKDQMEMEERRKAVRCLARVDCNWYPEAELALINSLRTDKAECVRLEAAKVLSIGCCGTKKVIDALTITVNASSKDGNPPENSPRVREMALVALQHALECYVEREEPQRPEAPGALPLPKAQPEKAPEKPAPAGRADLRDKAAGMEDGSGVVTAALRTLGQNAAEVQTAEGTRSTTKGMEGNGVNPAPSARQPQAAGWGNRQESSEAVLSRAMLTIQRHRAQPQAEKRAPGQALAKGNRSLVGIIQFAAQGRSSQGTLENTARESEEGGLKGSNQ
jgi:hypothetical protein